MEFSFSSYFRFLSTLAQGGYRIFEFGPPEDFPPSNVPFVILRHDVDVSLDAAIRLAERESREGIRSTYFFMISNQYYNLHSAEGRRALQTIRSLGHSIGLHFDETVYEAPNIEAFNRASNCESQRLEDLSSGPVVGVNFHRPRAGRIGTGIELTDPLPHSYMPFYVSDLDYCSDSTGKWRYGSPDERESIALRKPLHLLTHPIWLGEEPRKPEDQLLRFLQERQEKTMQSLSSECSVELTIGRDT